MNKAEANKFDETLENFRSKKEKLSKEDTAELVELALKSAASNENASNLCVEILGKEIETLRKNLNQQKVLIPKFVDDWLARDVTSLRRVFYMLDRDMIVDKKVSEWIGENEELLCAAYANGCEVEKEKLYYVDFINDGEIHKRLIVDPDNGRHDIVEWSDNLIGIVQEMFTESEIKMINSDYFAFAVEVEVAE